jgi:hypothetical protein
MINRGTPAPMIQDVSQPSIAAAVNEEIGESVPEATMNPVDESTPLEEQKQQETVADQNTRYRLDKIDIVNTPEQVLITQADEAKSANQVNAGGLMFVIKVDNISYGVFVSRVGVLSEQDTTVELESNEEVSPETETG